MTLLIYESLPHQLFKWIAILLGIILVLAGSATLLLPLPVGLPLMLLGLPLILRHSPHGRDLVMRLTRRSVRLSALMRRLGGHHRGAQRPDRHRPGA